MSRDRREYRADGTDIDTRIKAGMHALQINKLTSGLQKQDDSSPCPCRMMQLLYYRKIQVITTTR